MKPSNNTGSLSALPPPSPVGSFDTPLSHLSTSVPPQQLSTPKILGQCMANGGQQSTREPERDTGGMLWVECVCICPAGEYICLLQLTLGFIYISLCFSTTFKILCFTFYTSVVFTGTVEKLLFLSIISCDRQASNRYSS